MDGSRTELDAGTGTGTLLGTVMKPRSRREQHKGKDHTYENVIGPATPLVGPKNGAEHKPPKPTHRGQWVGKPLTTIPSRMCRTRFP